MHTWRTAIVLAALLPASSMGADLKDLYFGEALYYAYQERYFDALERLDDEIAQHYAVDEPQLDSLQHHIKTAEFDVGDFELRYRMHRRAGRAIKAVLEGDVPEPVRNDAAFRLARIHFQKGRPDEALRVLDGIRGEIPEDIRDDLEFLRANVYMALSRPSDAVDVLRRLQDSDQLRGFSTYNLGIALLESGKREEAIEELDQAGAVKGRDRATRGIRDKANLVLGTLLFEASEFEPAERSLNRVRLKGPFANQALLRAGWADASSDRYERALVPWGILSQRESTDAAVQEALLALPYAYSRLNVHGRAALLYGRAVDTFGSELEKLDASIRSVENGEFLKALAQQEIRQDKDWVIHLRSLPDAPETFYLMSLMASHDFQTSLQNYLDLEDMRKRLVSWQRSLDSFRDLIRLRQQYYEPVLPEIDERFRKLDAQIRLRLEQRALLEKRLQHMLIGARPDYLATADERRVIAWADRVLPGLENSGDPAAADLLLRVRRLKGLITWTLETDYHERLTTAFAHLRELNADVETLTGQYDAFVRSRQAATQSYVGYERPLESLGARIVAAREQLTALMSRQGQILEAVANRELRARRERLETYQNQARFAFADSYDRASKAQAQ